VAARSNAPQIPVADAAVPQALQRVQGKRAARGASGAPGPAVGPWPPL